MSVRAMTWALTQNVGDPTRKLILIALADFADNNGKCWPGQAVLAEVANCSVDTVQRHLKKLVADGKISRERRNRKSGARASDGYLLHVDSLSRKLRSRPKPQSAAPPKPHSYAVAIEPPVVRLESSSTVFTRPKTVGASGSVAAGSKFKSSVPQDQQLAKLNGSASLIVENLAAWEKPSAPEPKIAADAIATQVAIHGPEIVKDAYGLLASEMPGGSVKRPIVVFARICQRLGKEARAAAAGPEAKPYPGYIGRGG